MNSKEFISNQILFFQWINVGFKGSKFQQIA